MEEIKVFHGKVMIDGTVEPYYVYLVSGEVYDINYILGQLEGKEVTVTISETA